MLSYITGRGYNEDRRGRTEASTTPMRQFNLPNVLREFWLTLQLCRQVEATLQMGFGRAVL